jgi:hypothetical protein
LQVAAELGRKYEDTIALMEPDHDQWQDRLMYDFGFDATDGNPYPGDWITANRGHFSQSFGVLNACRLLRS